MALGELIEGHLRSFVEGRPAGNAPPISRLLQSAFDAAAIMDDQSSLLLATATHAIYEVITPSHRVRAPPKRGTFCELAEEQAHGTEYFGPLR